ncbi:hypothetical protein [Patulibacter sp. SYSU D01012]|uniref:hypothetical protein n=1 Tax=Patulibacter sp. SYSU D01012 TaxID=2817381 RepID=UPI001B31454E|nr:hypothetical protein [Patulibacter sp. SYSU D01012]
MPISHHVRPGNARLAARWLDYDRTACPERRDELVAALMPTVRTVVLHACGPDGRADAAALWQAGVDGLVSAIETFEPTGRTSLEQHVWSAVVAAVHPGTPHRPLTHPLAA